MKPSTGSKFADFSVSVGAVGLPALKRPIPPQSKQLFYLHQLKQLSGLDYYECRLVARMLATGVKTTGDQKCLNAIIERHLQPRSSQKNK
jgi:hypothetical protein